MVISRPINKADIIAVAAECKASYEPHVLSYITLQ